MPWRKLATTAFLPNLLAGLAVAAVLPVLPRIAIELGASIVTSAFVVAALTIGQLSGNVLGGALVIRIGERRSMIVGAGLGVGGGLLGFGAVSVGTLVVASLVTGISVSVLALARHAFVTVLVPAGQRARAMSLLAGCMKLGHLLGPFSLLVLLGLGASTRSAFALVAAGSAVVGLLIVTSRGFDDEGHVGTHKADGVWAAARANTRALVVVGTGAALLGMLRVSRLVLVPLWGIAIGLSASEVALVVGISTAFDVALFYVGGVLMDRFGRLRVTVPALLVIAVAHVAMALIDHVAEEALLLMTVASVMAMANAMTSGVIMTLGSDLADPRRLAGFLSAWRLVTESGPAMTPIIIASTAAVSLGFASLTMGAIALLSAALLGLKAGPFLPPLERAH